MSEYKPPFPKSGRFTQEQQEELKEHGFSPARQIRKDALRRNGKRGPRGTKFCRKLASVQLPNEVSVSPRYQGHGWTRDKILNDLMTSFAKNRNTPRMGL